MESKKIKVIELQGLPHTLTQKNGKTFRLFARESKIIDEKQISNEFLAEQKMGCLMLVPVKNEETKISKGGAN